MIRFHKQVIPVYTYGAPVLKVPAAPIGEITPAVRELAGQMIETMFAFDGIGLAAPQVGASIRLVVFGLGRETAKDAPSLSPGEDYLLPRMPLAVVNPQILMTSNESGLREEGCLSVPDIWAQVQRPLGIVFQAQTLTGESFTVECQGMLARCIQHELDHLDGKLFVDKTAPDEFARIKPELDALLLSGQANQFLRRRP